MGKPRPEAVGKGKNKPRPEKVLAVRVDDGIVTIVAIPKPPTDKSPVEKPFFDSKGAKRALAAKVDKQEPLTEEERDHLMGLLGQKRRTTWVPDPKEALRLRVAQYFIILRNMYPKKGAGKILDKSIRDMVAKTFGCSEGSVRQDVRFARDLDHGSWWQLAERDLTLPTF